MSTCMSPTGWKQKRSCWRIPSPVMQSFPEFASRFWEPFCGGTVYKYHNIIQKKVIYCKAEKLKDSLTNPLWRIWASTMSLENRFFSFWVCMPKCFQKYFVYCNLSNDNISRNKPKEYPNSNDMMGGFLRTGFVWVRHVNNSHNFDPTRRLGDKCRAQVAEPSKELLWSNSHLGDKCGE